jgi:hypothetical protein
MADPEAAAAPAADPLAGARVLVGVTGGIAAYKAAILVRLLQRAGARVDVILTRGGARFVGAATFEGLTGRAVRQEVWEDIAGETHVALGRGADAVVVYPATAHTLAKLAGGLADDLLSTSLLAATCPLVLAPAMHTEMWEHAGDPAQRGAPARAWGQRRRAGRRHADGWRHRSRSAGRAGGGAVGRATGPLDEGAACVRCRTPGPRRRRGTARRPAGRPGPDHRRRDAGADRPRPLPR